MGVQSGILEPIEEDPEHYFFFYFRAMRDVSNRTLKSIDNFHHIKIEKHLYYKRCLKHIERQWACLENVFATYKAKD